MGSVGEGGSVAAGKARYVSSPSFNRNKQLAVLKIPRVDGSIPSPATTSKFLIFMSFLASPADHRASFCPEIG